jgi:hypothetical protein
MASTSARSPQSATSSGHRPAPDTARQLNPWQWIWPSLWVVLLTGSGIFCGWALWWLARIPPVPDCEQITPFHAARDLLYCAKAQARTGEPNNLTQSVHLTADWPRTHANYEEAQEVLKDASEQILVLANRLVQEGRIEDAKQLAGEIPLGTPLRQTAQAMIYEWQQNWQQGQDIESQIYAALGEQNWQQAQAQMQALKALKGDYWLSTRSAFWQRQFQLEQSAWNQLQSARKTAQSGQPEDLKQALTLAHAIDLRSQVWGDAEAYVTEWSKALLTAGLQQWQAGNQAAALELVRGVPSNLADTPDGQALIRVSQAKELMAAASPEGQWINPQYRQMLALMAALNAMEQVPADSAFAAAIEDAQTWPQELEDLRQLKFAQVVSTLGLRPAYEWSIAQAQRIDPERPRRIQGQTMIAEWQIRIQRLEDRPILRQAQQLAKPGTIADLQAAIAEASKVELGRSLRVEAQTLIAAWQQEIQVIEDRPILDTAVALANQGKLREAIEAARKIESGRALHSRARDLILDWTTTIQIAEDKPILDEAKDLAYVGSLSAAINMASQIAPGRALYDEAQRAIALWKAEREYIWSIWEAEGRSTPNSNNSSNSNSE